MDTTGGKGRAMSNAEDRGRLQALDADEDLAGLRRPAAKFNIFEATGDVRRELNHSRFLHFLLNPQSSHELQDRFIKSLLRRAFPREDFTPTFSSPSRWTTHREYYLTDDETGEQGFVDILLLHAERKLAVIIENKIDSGERPKQLDLYYRVLDKRGWKARGVYLTRHGLIPSHSKYVPVSYGVVCDAIDELLIDQTVAGDVRTIMMHYVDMVRRDIVDELDIDAACQRLYRKHELAFRLVHERVSTRHTKMRDTLESRVLQLVGQENARNCIDEWKVNYNTTILRFILPEWKNRATYTEKWSRILKCILEFAIAISPQEVFVDLKIGPGNSVTRRNLFDLARRNKDIFNFESPLQEYTQVYHRPLLSAEKYEELGTDALVREVEQQWDGFVGQDLLRIRDAIQTWLNEAGNSNAYSNQ